MTTPLQRVRDRYYTDTTFHVTVDALAKLVEDLELTPGEVREAAMFACSIVEERHGKPIRIVSHNPPPEKDPYLKLTKWFPHCDPYVLHAPGVCEHCDLPEFDPLRDYRNARAINFTGEHAPTRAPCPSEARRPLETIERWPGNRPEPTTPPARCRGSAHYFCTRATHHDGPCALEPASPRTLYFGQNMLGERIDAAAVVIRVSLDDLGERFRDWFRTSVLSRRVPGAKPRFIVEVDHG